MMNSSDFEYLSCEANREGHLGDVLQVFVHDFTLRQGAGEAKMREVERKVGGVTSELFILRKLLQDFQTRVNDDHDIIMRLQHEIEALQSRVRSIDSKQAAADTQCGHLNVRIEQLRDQISQNCDDTQQNVSRLLSSFARVHLTRGSARNDNLNNNNRDYRQDNSPTNDVSGSSARWGPSRGANLSCRSETMTNAINSIPHQNSVAPPETTTFPHAATTYVSNEECCLNDGHDTITGGPMQPRPLCDGLTSGEEGCMHEISEAVSETSALADSGCCQTLQEVSNSSSVNNDCSLGNEAISDETESHDESPSVNFAPDENLREDANHGVISEAPESVNSIYKDMNSHETWPVEDEVNEINREETPSHNATQEELQSTFTLFSDDKANEHHESPCSVISQERDDLPDFKMLLTTSQSHNEPSSTKASEETPTPSSMGLSPTTGECSGDVISQEKTESSAEKTSVTSETTSTEAPGVPDESGASQMPTRKNKPKRHRGRKRKDSQSTENQAVPGKTEGCPTARTEEACSHDTVQEVQSQEFSSDQCSQNDNNMTYDLSQEVMVQQLIDSDTLDQCETKQPSSQDSEQEQTVAEVVDPQLSQLQPACDEFKPRQSFAPDSEGGELASAQCIRQEVLPDKHGSVATTKFTQTENKPTKGQRSFNLKVESASPQTRRRGVFHSEIDDDEIPDLSDIDSLTEEEEKKAGKGKATPWEERKAIEIKTPSGEITNLQTKRKPKATERRMEAKEEEQKDDVVGMCANCSNLAKLRCGNCRQAFYCKKECQKEHWKTGHKDQCRPYQVLQSPELGRYMVASRDLKAGDVILKEDPIVVGPKQITEPVCLGCYKRVDGSYRCQKCHWPLCSPQCERSPDHLPECVVGAEIGSPIEISNFDEPNHFYEVVFPLRCLALKKKSPRKYEQVLALDNHYEDRKGTHVYAENQKSIVNMLRNYFFLQQFPVEDIDSSEKSIHNMTGIIDVNALEIRLPESEILGLFPNFAMMEHSCTPNTKHTFTDSRQVVLKAAVDIKAGEHLSTMYTHILWGTLARRDHLKHSKYFMCTCFRCSDPTELGTNFSTLRCKSCTNGFMLSAAPLDELADWICTSCNATIKSAEVTDINLKLGEEVERTLGAPTVPLLEELLQKHGKTTVHPNHFHLFATRHTLLQMYGRDPAYANEDYMKKKERMCQDFLKVCTALDPGMSRLAPYAGVALYEYHLAVLSRTRHDQDARQTDPAALKKDVETAKALLQQCIKVLQEEPKDQPEGQLCQVAQQNLIELRQWEANLSRLDLHLHPSMRVGSLLNDT
ncbi:uncharacterized protein LOC135209187 [Macrobrachium nipponense]|uniref:uncharacterized protein LOC135209187 n=1 Tax=Macrobrachium nipponense TaxID=159736 RepID=UPI0030C88138